MLMQYYTWTQHLMLVLHVRTGMGGSILMCTWHKFISRLATYLKYQGLAIANASNTMELISVHMESRYPTVYTLC